MVWDRSVRIKASHLKRDFLCAGRCLQCFGATSGKKVSLEDAYNFHNDLVDYDFQ